MKSLQYAKYLSEITGFDWQLPNELEWEKAAGGVDGRRFPWGDHVDPSWTCIRESHKAKGLPVSVYSTPIDVSPFGIHGMGGNARDWTGTNFRSEGPLVENGQYQKEEAIPVHGDFYTVKGGSWFDLPRFVRVASRGSEVCEHGNSMVSFRLVRSF